MNKSRINKKSVYFITLFLISGMMFLSSLYIQNQILKKNLGENSLNLSTINEYQEEWLRNSNFSIPINPWVAEVQGDSSDVNPISSLGQANYEILGETHTFSEISGTPIFSEWTKVHNPEFPLYPDTAIIEPYGCEVSHEFRELSDQFPSVHWERNVTMPLNMSDYIITSASLSAIVNATVTAYPGGWHSVPQGWGIETPGDDTGPYQDDNDQFFTGDYVRFYVLLSDLEKEKVYEVAYNQTIDLGKDSAGALDYMLDTFMNTVSEEDLIFYLTSVLTSDFRNFTMTIGMRIWCEDNWYTDQDRWDSLLIKSCNLTFTYEKKIDRFTTASWNQIGNTLSGENIEITGGNLKFKYKIDQLWPVDSSPNSAIRFFINDNSLLETTKLSSASTTFQEAKTGGFDVTTLLLKDVNISVSIQVFLADTFALNQDITISITDVYLDISYTEFIPDTEEAPWFFIGIFIIALVAVGTLTGFLIAYIKVWRYPVPVRKVRKYNKTLTKEKGPDLKIVTRKTAFNKNFHDELKKTDKILKGTQMNGKILRDKLLDKKEGVLPK